MGEQSTMESQMSSIESSQMSTIEGGGDSKGKSSMPILLGLCFVMLLVAGIGYAVFAASAGDETEPTDVKRDGPSQSGPSGSPPSYNPAPDKPTKDKGETTEADTQQSPAGTETTDAGPAGPTQSPPAPGEFSVSDLVCTVGERAVMAVMMPPDKLCTFLYYSDVVVSGGKLYGARSDFSWNMFQKEITKRSVTKGGLSFDIKYIEVQQLEDQKVASELSTLAGSNMANYGLLTVVAESAKLAGVITKAKDVIDKLKSIQGKDKDKKTVIALGLYDYGLNDAWATYQEQFKAAVETTKADVVIALSSTGWQESDTNCLAAPPNAVEPTNKRFPDMKQHASLVAKGVQYSRDAKLGLSFEIGTLLYTMSNANLDLDKVPYAKCIRSTTDHQDSACIEGYKPTKKDGTYFGQVPNNKVVAFSFDDDQTMMEKFNTVKSSSELRPEMAWLVNNAHLGSYDKTCGGDKPFSRLEFIRKSIFKMP